MQRYPNRMRWVFIVVTLITMPFYAVGLLLLGNAGRIVGTRPTAVVAAITATRRPVTPTIGSAEPTPIASITPFRTLAATPGEALPEIGITPGVAVISTDNGSGGDDTVISPGVINPALTYCQTGSTFSYVDALGGGNVGGQLSCKVLVNDFEIGNSEVVQQGVQLAIEVTALNGATSVRTFESPVRACLQGSGRIAYLNANASPRVPSYPGDYSAQNGYTCYTVTEPGTVVLLR